MVDLKRKITSRKFWLSVAAFLGSIAVSVSGIVTGEKWVTITGTVCGILSAAIYSAAEAYVDGANKYIILEEEDDGDESAG